MSLGALLDPSWCNSALIIAFNNIPPAGFELFLLIVSPLTPSCFLCEGHVISNFKKLPLGVGTFHRKKGILKVGCKWSYLWGKVTGTLVI